MTNIRIPLHQKSGSTSFCWNAIPSDVLTLGQQHLYVYSAETTAAPEPLVLTHISIPFHYFII